MIEAPFATTAAVLTAGLGLWGLVAPREVAAFVGVEPQGARGVAELRATYGGLFAALGVFRLIAQSNVAFAAAAAAWWGAAGGRLLAIGLARGGCARNWGGVLVEAGLGTLFLLDLALFA
ncbi:MAG: hypothetical protein ACK5TK_01230 [Betaproteobacteria bacterium]